MSERPKCWDCGEEVIWGGDHDAEYDIDMGLIVSNYSCPNCQAFYLKYWGKADAENETDR